MTVLYLFEKDAISHISHVTDVKCYHPQMYLMIAWYRPMPEYYEANAKARHPQEQAKSNMLF